VVFYPLSVDNRHFGRKFKINRNFVGILRKIPVHLYLLRGVCTQKTKSKLIS